MIPNPSGPIMVLGWATSRLYKVAPLPSATRDRWVPPYCLGCDRYICNPQYRYVREGDDAPSWYNQIYATGETSIAFTMDSNEELCFTSQTLSERTVLSDLREPLQIYHTNCGRIGNAISDRFQRIRFLPLVPGVAGWCRVCRRVVTRSECGAVELRHRIDWQDLETRKTVHIEPEARHESYQEDRKGAFVSLIHADFCNYAAYHKTCVEHSHLTKEGWPTLLQGTGVVTKRSDGNEDFTLSYALRYFGRPEDYKV
jgi:hypothetical protein